MWKSLETSNFFITLTLKLVFRKARTFFKKKLGYRFLVESTTIENPTFPYKIALSKANVELNGAEIEMGLSQRTVPRTFICLKI